MSAFYGTVEGNGKTNATRRGFNKIRVSAQSYNGSLITELYIKDGVLMRELEHNDGSGTKGYTIFKGTFEELIEKISQKKENDNLAKEIIERRN